MTEQQHPFVEYLIQLASRDDRAALASLRQGFVNPLRALPLVAPFLRHDDGRGREEALLLVGGLFALHPVAGNVTLARALRQVATSTGSTSVELRFRALLECDADDLSEYLRHGVSLVAREAIPLDYSELLASVRSWSHETRFVQRRWARQFWAVELDSARFLKSVEG